MRKKDLTIKKSLSIINNSLDKHLMNQIKGGDGQTTTTSPGSSYQQGMSLLEAQSTKK
ncbi:MAG: hypothetical protein H6536_08525 [Bacteroidales bacterium]|nr:hypothetical protein [Bacteroidales bacterium]